MRHKNSMSWKWRETLKNDLEYGKKTDKGGK
uniref:Uncharacterized protein n=1 Tax=Trichinella nativa TaxID=6335 RepID=A0A0V1KI02_9BILA